MDEIEEEDDEYTEEGPVSMQSAASEAHELLKKRLQQLLQRKQIR